VYHFSSNAMTTNDLLFLRARKNAARDATMATTIERDAAGEAGRGRQKGRRAAGQRGASERRATILKVAPVAR